MSKGMRDDESRMRRLGDFPLDRGQQEPERSNAAAWAPQRDQQPMPVAEGLRRKFALEAEADQGFLLRQREVQEASNLVTQLHPINDVTFFSRNTVFSSGPQTIAPGTTDGIVQLLFGPNDGAVPARHVAIVRSVMPVLFDAAAEADLRITVQIGAKVDEGTFRVRPSSFMNFRANSYYRVMQMGTMNFLVTNSSAVLAHDIEFLANGWFYPVNGVKETARGVIPRDT